MPRSTFNATNLTIVESDETSRRVLDEAVENWLFPDQATTVTEHLDNLASGEVYQGATIRQVVEFNMKDADVIFQSMTEDSATENETVYLSGGVLELCSKKTTIKMKNIIKAPKGATYVLVSGAIIKYRSLTAPFSVASPVCITLEDKGLAPGSVSPSVTFSKTLGANILMGLSYPIPVRAVSDLLMEIEVGITGVLKGRPWGTLEVAFNLQFSSKPLTAGQTRSFVQYELPSDLFEIEATDPRTFNATLSQQDLDRLRSIKDQIPGARSLQLDTNGVLAPKTRINKAGTPVAPPQKLFEVTDENFLSQDPFSLANVPDSSSESSGASATPPLGLSAKNSMVSSPIRMNTPALELAADKLRARGFEAQRLPENIRLLSEKPGGLEGITGTYSVLSAVMPELALSGSGAAGSLTAHQRALLAPYMGYNVHVSVSDEDPKKSVVKLAPFEGSFPISISALFGLMGEIELY